MNKAGKIDNVVIVGGGTAGWMSACYLALRTNCRVTLVESAETPPIGVGEATIPALLDFINALQLDESDFVRSCHATYKLGIQFNGWTRSGHSYLHPFGLCGGTIDGLDLFHFWLARRNHPDGLPKYSDYSAQAALCQAGRAHRQIGKPAQLQNYAFHLDAARLAGLLNRIAVANGVRRIEGTVRQVERSPEGRITSVRLTDASKVCGDFFVDCTGFRGLLIEDALGDKWVDWSDTLLCDRAVAAKTSSQTAPPPFTKSSAQAAGWIWDIPLSDRTGLGHVYSSRHMDDDSAAQTLLNYAGLDEDQAGELRQLNMRVGRRSCFWKSNCVSIGLSAGFVEPLESTGIFLVQRGLEELVDCFPDMAFSPAVTRVYNDRMSAAYDEVRDFVLLHYLMTERDEPYRQDARAVHVPDSLAERLELYQGNGMLLEADRNPVFRATNYYHVLTGGELYPDRVLPQSGFLNQQAVDRLLQRILQENQQLVAAMPSHRDLLRSIHGGETAHETTETLPVGEFIVSQA